MQERFDIFICSNLLIRIHDKFYVSVYNKRMNFSEVHAWVVKFQQTLHISPISESKSIGYRSDIRYTLGYRSVRYRQPISAVYWFTDLEPILIKTAFWGLYSFKSACTPTLSDLWATPSGIRKNIASMADHRTV